jgi:DNA-binding Lrp family transcriptional regulator
MVGLHNQAESDLIAFEERISQLDYVRECHMLNGEIDFILKCVAPDLSSFQSFLTNELTSAPNVASVKTSLTIRHSKYLPGVPLGKRNKS